MKKNNKPKDLVEIIKNNPGCIAIIDNDCWVLSKNASHPDDFEDWDYDRQEDWKQANILTCSDDAIVPRGSGYGSGCAYGGDILQALAAIVGVKIQSV